MARQPWVEADGFLWKEVAKARKLKLCDVCRGWCHVGQPRLLVTSTHGGAWAYRTATTIHTDCRQDYLDRFQRRQRAWQEV